MDYTNYLRTLCDNFDETGGSIPVDHDSKLLMLVVEMTFYKEGWNPGEGFPVFNDDNRGRTTHQIIWW
jgi:hypothetical protein